MQVWALPQEVPEALLVVATHTWVPVLHEYVPFLHGALGGVHCPPAAHVTHDPALQNIPFPQVLPSATLPPVVQTGAPVLHDTLTEWQGGAVQFATEHGVQTPDELQTIAFPQFVPAGRFPLSVQTATPVEQEFVPVLQRFEGVHVPVEQAAHAPLLQTIPLPQLAVPFGTALPLSTQVWLPVAQLYVPVWHGLPEGVQVPVPVHATQVPDALQTIPDPQFVPAGRLPVSLHTSDPVEQDGVPVLH